MARSKTDTVKIIALGQRRSQVAAEIAELQRVPNPLPDLVAELDEIEVALKAIDPTIPTLAEEAAIEAQRLADAATREADAKVNEIEKPGVIVTPP